MTLFTKTLLSTLGEEEGGGNLWQTSQTNKYRRPTFTFIILQKNEKWRNETLSDSSISFLMSSLTASCKMSPDMKTVSHVMSASDSGGGKVMHYISIYDKE